MSDDNKTTFCFVDSNIWLYALIVGNDTIKTIRAVTLIQTTTNIIVSTQVLNEVAVNLIKKAAFTEQEVRKLITSFYQQYMVVNLSHDILLRASQLREQHQISYWDSLIVASARAGGASIVYSEDMHDGMIIDNVLTIINPFK